ncbi:MAG: hypothetical protein K1X92_17990 [Bacteroidia bacterium]|nr:hypothetical protein [Bacteroidia bacterium]
MRKIRRIRESSEAGLLLPDAEFYLLLSLNIQGFIKGFICIPYLVGRTKQKPSSSRTITCKTHYARFRMETVTRVCDHS